MTTTNTTHAPSRPWSPTDRDRLIYHWVKFDGHKQTWVADQLGLNQSTVSRIVDRYERWIARGGLTQQGSPSRDERIRAQRWLTYERNEWILASCMRLANEMERPMDTSNSTILHHAVDPSREIEVRTAHKTLERSGTACRFLRLAHRVNMDQEKLLAKLDLPALEPLTLDPNEYSAATADARIRERAAPARLVVPQHRVPDDDGGHLAASDRASGLSRGGGTGDGAVGRLAVRDGQALQGQRVV